MSYLQMLQRAQRDASPNAALGAGRERTREVRPIDAEISQAMRLLNSAGVRIMRIGSDLQIGVWEDLDCPEVRAAIRSVGLHVHPTVHLESAEVPMRFKVRRCPDRAKGEAFAAWLKRAEALLPGVIAAYVQEMEEP